MDSTIKLPECPTCYNEFSTKRVCYIVCFNGHSICEVCNKKRKNRLECPICRQSTMPTGGIVNRSMMDMIAEICKANPTLNKEASKPVPPADAINQWKLFCEEGKIEEMKKVLDIYHSEEIIDFKDADGISILSKAIILGREDVVALLLDYGANMAIKTQDDRSIILLACENMDVEMMKLLFNKDEDEVLVGDYIQDAFNYACENGYLDIVMLLADKGVDINHKDTNCHNMTPLMRAVKKGHEETVNYLIEEDAEIDDVDSMQRTALYHACESGYVKVVELLIYAAADLQTSKDMNFLIAACKGGHADVIKLLLANGVRADETNANTQTALMIACQNGYTKIVEVLLKYNTSLHRMDDKGNTALMYACRGGWMDIVYLLISHRNTIDIQMINYKNDEGQTALMIAAEYGYIDIVTYLIEKQAVLYLTDLREQTALMIACKAGHTKIVEILIDKGADVELQDSMYMDVMLQACEGGNLAMVQALIKKGMNVDSTHEICMTPLFAAIEGRCTHIVDFLLSQGAQANAKSSSGMTAFMYACEEGLLEVLPILYDRDPSVINMTDKEGWTPLMSACAEGHTAILTWLLDRNPDMSIREQDGMTAYHVACGRGKNESIKVLVDRCNCIQHIEDHIKGLFLAVELGHVETVRYLLTIGIHVNSVDDEGMTALMCACRGAHYDIVKVLVENGANVHITTASNYNALSCISDITITTSKYPTATSYKTGPRYEIIKYLLDQGADLESKDDQGMTLLLRLCAWGHVNTMKSVVVLGANAYAVDCYGNDVLMLACDRKDMYMPVLQYVLTLPDISINQQNYMRDTALMIASRSQYHSYEKIAILVEREGIQLNIRNDRGETALMMICALGNSRATTLLLSHSTIDVNIQDYEGNTALMKAVQSGYLNIVQLLVEHGAKVDIVNNKGMTVIQMVDISARRKPSKTIAIKRYFERISVAAAATSNRGDINQNDNTNSNTTTTSSTNSNADQSNVSNVEMVDHTSSNSLTTIPITHTYGDSTTSHNSISVNEPIDAGSSSDNHHDNGNDVCMKSSSSGYIHSDSIDSNVTTDRSDSDAKSSSHSVEEDNCSDNNSKENYNNENDLNDNSDVRVYVPDIQCHTQEENKRKNENDRDISEDSTMEQPHIKRNRST